LVVVVLIVPEAYTLVAEIAFVAETFPWTWRVAPRLVEVPTPMNPAVPKRADVFIVVTFAVTAQSVPKRVAAFPIETDEEAALMSPLNVE
jgi:hypothetical protein